MGASQDLLLVLKAKDLASKQVSTLSSNLGKVEKKSLGVGKAFKTLGKVAAVGIAGIGIGLALAAPGLLEMGAQIEQMKSKIKTVFGSRSKDVQKWADSAAERMGITSLKAQGLAASFGDLLIPMGFTRTEAAKMSTDVIGLSGALAEWTGGQRTTAEVADILSKAMLGEREGLKELGISISEADVKQQMMKDGTDKLKGAQLAQAKATATQKLIFAKSKDAQKAYADGSLTLLGRQAKLKAKFDTVIETISTKLIPVFLDVFDWVETKLVPAFTDFVTWVGGVVTKIQAFFDSVKKNKQTMTTLRDIAKAIGDAFNWIAGNIQSALRGFNMVSDWYKKYGQPITDFLQLLKFLPTGGGGAVGLGSEIGKNLFGGKGKARGGPAHGPTLVGERGPELVNIPGRGFVTPNNRLRGGSAPQTIVLNIDGREVGRVVVPAVSRQMFYELQRAAPTLGRT